MKLRRVVFDRYVGADLDRSFTDQTHDIDLDPATRLVTLTPKAGGEFIVVVAHNADMYPYPKEAVSEPGPARPLPGRPRKGA